MTQRLIWSAMRKKRVCLGSWRSSTVEHSVALVIQINSPLCRSAEADGGRHHMYGTHTVVPGAGISRVRVQANCPKVACVIALLALL